VLDELRREYERAAASAR